MNGIGISSGKGLLRSLAIVAILALMVVGAVLPSTPKPTIAPAGPVPVHHVQATVAGTSQVRPHAKVTSRGPVPGVDLKRMTVPAVAGSTSTSSINWSGYTITHAGYSFDAIRGKWQQPAANCADGKTTEAVFWIGLDGFGSSTVEQVGTGVECYQGRAYYFAWWEMVPTAPHIVYISNMAVHAGDNFTGNVSHVGSLWTLQLADTTTGTSWASNFGCSNCSAHSAEWIAEAPCVAVNCTATTRLANYGVATFWATGAASGGVTGNAGSWNSYAEWMYGPAGDWRSEPYTLYNSNTAFQVHFLSQV